MNGERYEFYSYIYKVIYDNLLCTWWIWEECNFQHLNSAHQSSQEAWGTAIFDRNGPFRCPWVESVGSQRTRFRWKTGIMTERYEIHMRYHFLAALQDLVQEMWQWFETVWFSKMIVRQSDAQHIRFGAKARIQLQPFDRRSSIQFFQISIFRTNYGSIKKQTLV